MAPNHGNSRWETESNLRAPIKSRNESNLPQKITRDQVRYNLMGHITEDRPGLLRFYPDPETLLGEDAGPEGQDIVERAYKTAQLATEMGVGSSVAMVLSLLALYDLVILANNSMAMEIRQGGAQIHNLRNILFEISKLYLPASTNNSGITGVVFPNSLPDYILKQNGLTQKNVFRDVKPDDMAGMFSQVQWAGFTALGIGMAEKVLSEFVSLGPEMKKPVIITTITDHPNEGEPMHYLKYQIWIQAVDLMRDHGNHGFQAISYQFAMIGNDIQAKDFLTTLKEEQTLEAFVDVMLSELDGIQVLTSRERKKSGLLVSE
ncbi:hypothetical protein DFH27DRAFT_120690 [Peziza echinospora]|nr:hypothetical protein DFH27DRAFT_120690 [Peziza echinospora]